MNCEEVLFWLIVFIMGRDVISFFVAWYLFERKP